MPEKNNTFDIVIFGATGDLAYRKLFPALYYRYLEHTIQPNTRILATSRSALKTEEYRKQIKRFMIEKVFVSHSPSLAELDDFFKLIEYIPIDVTNDAHWDRLARALGKGAQDNRIFYLATASKIYETICKHLDEQKLITPTSKIVLEKPIGYDLDSAIVINKVVTKFFKESQIYRIDHYLGKETVQNLLALRFGNTIFERLWHRDLIDYIEISVAEKVGLENRIDYYNTSGALRDMVQNHLLQLVTMVAMDCPYSLKPDAIRDEKMKVIRSLKPIDESNVCSTTVRGQYAAGHVDGKRVKGYSDELGSTSNTETFVALRLEINSIRWAGVPFYIRTGKRLKRKMSEIIVKFKAPQFSIFSNLTFPLIGNRLVIRLEPEEGIKLLVMSKDPSLEQFILHPINLDMAFQATFKSRIPTAYERLFKDIIDGNQVLFLRNDEVEAAWSWSDTIQQAWKTVGQDTLSYASGSWGPSEANRLFIQKHHSWNEE